MLRRITVQKLERVIASRRGQVRWLTPGVYWLFGFGWKVQREPVTRASLDAPSPVLEQLACNAETWKDLAFVNPRAEERALVWIDGQLAHVHGQGLRAFWRTLRDVRVELVDARTVIEPALAGHALAATGAGEALEAVTVPQGTCGVLFANEEFQEELPAGRYAVWRGPHSPRIEIVPTGPKVESLWISDAWTRDLATVEVEVKLTTRIPSPRRWAEAGEPARAFVRDVPYAPMRLVIARTTVAGLLGDSAATSLALETAIAKAIRGRGVDVLGASVGRVTVRRRLPKTRFRGFGQRGDLVSAALRDYAARPHFRPVSGVH